jgi:hypothetical protein
VLNTFEIEDTATMALVHIAPADIAFTNTALPLEYIAGLLKSGYADIMVVTPLDEILPI